MQGYEGVDYVIGADLGQLDLGAALALAEMHLRSSCRDSKILDLIVPSPSPGMVPNLQISRNTFCNILHNLIKTAQGTFKMYPENLDEPL